MSGRLILFPVHIGCDDLSHSLPAYNLDLLYGCHTFIVEELRTARRFLKHAGYPHSIDSTTFFLLNEHTGEADVASYLDAAQQGEDVGLLSEAGLPCVADPGRLITRQAQQAGIEVVPLVGPSSIMLALMASGFNGQNFAFCGYLPVDRHERATAIRTLEQRVLRNDQTQIFIEAPYRNNQMLATLAETLHHDTMVCVACDLTLPSQYIVSRPASQWRNDTPNLHKRNTVFLIGK
ncbi:MAG: SAM-dependent methyltransferase [Bacteroidales bacterium]|nr:SAM-dependent methyltransferase [Bacteroidales bacterium]